MLKVGDLVKFQWSGVISKITGDSVYEVICIDVNEITLRDTDGEDIRLIIKHPFDESGIIKVNKDGNDDGNEGTN